MGKSVFFNGVKVGISTTLQGQSPCSGAISQQKLDIMLFFVWLFLFIQEGERQWNWMGMDVGEDLGAVGLGKECDENISYEILK